jgi:hypothetical protein
MTNVVGFEPYHVLGQWEEVTALVRAIGITRNDDVLLTLALRLRELHRDMFDALQGGQRQRLEAQLTASVERMKRREGDLNGEPHI